MAKAEITLHVAVEYPAHWTEDERNRERHHRERMASVQAETEARVLAHQVGYPTDYEVRRDAFTLAVDEVHGTGEVVSDGDLLGRAKWWRRQLRRTDLDNPPEPATCFGECEIDVAVQHKPGCEFHRPELAKAGDIDI